MDQTTDSGANVAGHDSRSGNEWERHDLPVFSRAVLAWRHVRAFVPSGQAEAMLAGLRGEESDHFAEKMIRLATLISNAPRTRESDPDDPIVWLHYFRGSVDAFITELDIEQEQHQAFGAQDVGYGHEMGYISIVELVENDVELDLYFAPKRLSEVLRCREALKSLPRSSGLH